MHDHPLLDIENLVVTATSGTRLVDSVSLKLERGSVLGLIGESGAGKSTIALAALAYSRPGCHITGGTIRHGGVDLMELDEDARRAYRGARIAYVAQSAAAAFNPALTLMDQICEGPVRHGLASRKDAEAHAVELFTALDLPDPARFGRRYPHQVSGGQLQRAMVAMAMSCRPDILVLDEPTTALDVTTQIEVLVLLRRLIRDQQVAALYVTHDLAVVAQIADRIMVLRHGKLVEEGATADVLLRPTTDYARALVAERTAARSAAFEVEDKRPETVLVLDHVDVSYGPKKAVSGVSFSLSRGETVAVIGESGSGKSTIAYSIAGLVSASGGEIQFDGGDLPPGHRERDRDTLRRIQLVYQLPDVALNPRQSIGEIIGRPLTFYFGLRGEARSARVGELLSLVGLPVEFAQRLPGQLSGGQKQRVCIARALAAEPDVVICDEVTSALDPLVAEEILKLLHRLQAELGLAYLFITHDLGIVRRIGHRVVVLANGKMVADGTTAEIFAQTDHPYIGKLIASVPELDTGWLDRHLQERTAS
ncbi:ABC transporter ATP-binding protein [Oryzibacter oryziterrae]|uniref:ABC transporter ATP-binding protein n=1 Tax=Oryzibacter oryziterrae TaxID=2766474 RepID=UPI0036F3D941